MVKPRRGLSRSKLTTDKPLTLREQRFVDAVLVDPDQMKAAKAAGYTAKNDRSLSVLACNLRNKSNVASEIARRMAIATRKADITVVDVLLGLKELAFSNMGDYLEQDRQGLPRFKNLKRLSREQLAALSEVSVIEDGLKRTIRFKLHNKRDALVDLGRYLKMFVEAQGANGSGNGHTTNNTLVVIQDALSATDGIIERILAGGALEGHAAAMPDRPVLPLEVHPSQA